MSIAGAPAPRSGASRESTSDLPNRPERQPRHIPHPGRRRPCDRRLLLCHHGGMTDRLSATDASFLYAEDAGTPMHVGGVVILKPDADGP